MTYRIKHVTLTFLFAAIAVIFIVMGITMISYDLPLGELWFPYILLVLIPIDLILWILFVVDQIYGAKLSIDDEMLTIRTLCSKKSIPVKTILNMELSRHTIHSYRANRHEHRIMLAITLINGKTIRLTDTAGSASTLFSSGEPMPDEDIALIQAYTQLNRIIKRIKDMSQTDSFND